jgi:hypothetical protein
VFLCIYTFTVFVPADGNVVKALWLQIIKFVWSYTATATPIGVYAAKWFEGTSNRKPENPITTRSRGRL